MSKLPFNFRKAASYCGLLAIGALTPHVWNFYDDDLEISIEKGNTNHETMVNAITALAEEMPSETSVHSIQSVEIQKGSGLTIIQKNGVYELKDGNARTQMETEQKLNLGGESGTVAPEDGIHPGGTIPSAPQGMPYQRNAPKSGPLPQA